MIQKRRGTTNVTRKLQRVKSEEQMPLGSLMHELGQLKEELKTIKHAKKNQQSSVTIKNSHNSHNKQNSLENQLNCVNLHMLSKEHRLKVQIVWGRLSKSIDASELSKVKADVKDLVETLVAQMADCAYQVSCLKGQLRDNEKWLRQERVEHEERLWGLSDSNKRLERELQQLRNQSFLRVTEKQAKNQHFEQQYQRIWEVNTQLKVELQELTKNNFQYESLIEQWQLQCRQLQERRLFTEKTVIAKEQQIRVLHQDVKYLRIESQKFKSQKRQFERLWQRANVELKEFKIAFEEEVLKAEREKTKWMNECSMRRHQSEQIQAIQSQKELLANQIHDMRNGYSLKCKELSENKTLLHQLQRKLIEVEADSFRMATELEKGQMQRAHWESEIVNLKRQFEGLSVYGEKRGRAKEGSVEKSREEKKQALDDIKSLIKRFRNSD